MCCDLTGTLDLPADVIEALAAYRRMLDERPYDWGDEQVDFFRYARFMQFGPVMEQFGALSLDPFRSESWPKALRAAIASDLPAGVVVVEIGGDGVPRSTAGLARLAIDGRSVPVDVVIDSAFDAEVTVTVAGREVRIGPRSAALERVRVDGSDPVINVDLRDNVLRIEDAVRVVPSAELRLESSRCARCSSACGGAASRSTGRRRR